MTKQHKKDAIPENVGREELAHFWDTHDVADYWNELKPVKVKVAKPLEHIFATRFDVETLNTLQKTASKKGVGTGSLVRMLVKEGLQRLAA